MIISASYKTDIPTFYGDWFINRLRAGYCVVLNPYNRTAFRVSLQREDVDGFVFWTKNVGPFIRHLDVVRDMGYPFIIQHSVNGYPRELESRVVNAGDIIEHIRHVSARFGSRVCVWRYDPILITSVTPASFHLRRFATLAEQLAGVTDEVVISFAQIYRKTLQNLDRAATTSGFTWHDPSDNEKCELASALVDIAAKHGLRLSVCSQKAYVVPGAHVARCVDATRLEALSGKHIAARLRGNRKECGCCESKDIGDYDTCPHGCAYCYAVQSRETAERRFAEHDPHSEYLFNPVGQTYVRRESRSGQLQLFSDQKRDSAGHEA